MMGNIYKGGGGARIYFGYLIQTYYSTILKLPNTKSWKDYNF